MNSSSDSDGDLDLGTHIPHKLIQRIALILESSRSDLAYGRG